jgi:hypothetical protein
MFLVEKRVRHVIMPKYVMYISSGIRENGDIVEIFDAIYILII